MSDTREKAFARIQQRLVCLQDAIKLEAEPLDENTRKNREIATLRNLLTLTYDLLPDEITLQLKSAVELIEQGIPTGV